MPNSLPSQKPKLTSEVRCLTSVKSQKTRNPKKNNPPGRDRERFWQENGTTVAGIDEVGRGAWAGPLVSAAVILPVECDLAEVRDSKLLTPKSRTELSEAIHDQAVAVGVGVVEVSELNERGFSWALKECGSRAIGSLETTPSKVLLDGHHNYLGADFECETIVGGDATELCIAAASVVAKVYRDNLMVELDVTYPEYGFANHKGYGTAEHQKALAEHAPTDIHRSQWKPIQKLLEQARPSS